jgi:hypothetical protein
MNERRRGRSCGHTFTFGEPQGNNLILVKCATCDWSLLREGKKLREADLTPEEFADKKHEFNGV